MRLKKDGYDKKQTSKNSTRPKRLYYKSNDESIASESMRRHSFSYGEKIVNRKLAAFEVCLFA